MFKVIFNFMLGLSIAFGALIFGVIAGLFVVALVSALLAVIVMLLWNWLMPIAFGLKALTFLQAWALLILCNLLFKGSSYKKGEKKEKPESL